MFSLSKSIFFSLILCLSLVSFVHAQEIQGGIFDNGPLDPTGLFIRGGEPAGYLDYFANGGYAAQFQGINASLNASIGAGGEPGGVVSAGSGSAAPTPTLTPATNPTSVTPAVTQNPQPVVQTDYWNDATANNIIPVIPPTTIYSPAPTYSNPTPSTPSGSSGTRAVLPQTQSVPGISTPVTFVVTPDSPSTNTMVTIAAQSFTTDLNRAEFSWYMNGTLVKKATGITSMTFSSGNGTPVLVSVIVKTPDIGTVTNSVTIHPADVTLIWQSDGYTPPFYKGMALELYGSAFKVTAIPEFISNAGKRIDPKNLVYTWKKNGTIDPAQSGYGKDSFIASQSSYLRGGDDISVSVTTVAQDTTASKSITISPSNSDIVLYQDSPLYGPVYEQAVTNTLNLSAEEVTLRAEPFNTSIANPLSGSLSYDWSLNGGEVASFKDKNEITFRTTGGGGGQSDVQLNIQHKTNLLQGGQADLTIFQ